MTIEFRCPQCEKLLRTGDDKAGLRAKCPDCGSAVTVPVPAIVDDFEETHGAEFEVEAERTSSGPPALPAEAGHKPCPVCGEQIKGAAIRCRYCGEMFGSPPPGVLPAYMKPHRGPLILVFSILSWTVCFIFGIVAWTMASADLRDMQAGVMDPSGESLTNAGRIVAMVQFIMTGVIIGLFCLMIVFSLVFAAFAG